MKNFNDSCAQAFWSGHPSHACYRSSVANLSGKVVGMRDADYTSLGQRENPSDRRGPADEILSRRLRQDVTYTGCSFCHLIALNDVSVAQHRPSAEREF
jgi:hypothetical protein